MKKMLLFLIVFMLIFTFVVSSSAESRLSEFQMTLKGKWTQVITGTSSFYSIEYPSSNNSNPFSNSDKFKDSVYNIILTEDATGNVYIFMYASNSNGSITAMDYGLLTFSNNKNIMIIYNRTNSDYIIYKRVE